VKGVVFPSTHHPNLDVRISFALKSPIWKSEKIKCALITQIWTFDVWCDSTHHPNLDDGCPIGATRPKLGVAGKCSTDVRSLGRWAALRGVQESPMPQMPPHLKNEVLRVRKVNKVRRGWRLRNGDELGEELLVESGIAQLPNVSERELR